MDAEVNMTTEPQHQPDDEEEDPMPHQEVEICRICLLDSASMRGLFHPEDGSTALLSQKVMSFATVKIIPGDGLPSQICYDCCDKLEIAYKFKIQVEQADEVLRERLEAMKDELFFGDVEVNFSQHRNDVAEMSDVSLLLKDHIDSLDDQKINEQDVMQSEAEDKPSTEIVMEVAETEEQESEEKSQNFESNEDNKDEVLQSHVESQLQNEEIHVLQHETIVHDDNQFGTQELQDLMLNEMNDQEKMQNDLNHTHQLTLHEHNYVAEPLADAFCNHKITEDIDDDKDDIEKVKSDEEIEQSDKCEGPPMLEISHSQEEVVQLDVDNVEENYFENLNLSSRIKQSQSESSEKVYFMCYICEKQFLSKEVLKEHMHSHEEVRKTLSVSSKSPDKVPKTPEKVHNVASSPSKTPSSGKQPNKCPHCGKEYLYIISFNKHLRQHERENSDGKDDSMPLEVSFQEGDEDMDFGSYDDHQNVDSDSETEIKKEVEDIEDNQKRKEGEKVPLKCEICHEEFTSVEELQSHGEQHTTEDTITREEMSFEDKPLGLIETPNKNVKEEKSFVKKVDSKSLRCLRCSAQFPNKRSLTRHVESNHTKYTCKICNQSFPKKDQLRRHTEQRNCRLKNFKCTQCNKTFGNELTLRNHLIATNHRTILHGQEYDPNKRLKRVAAKAAQKIIDQIKNYDDSDDEEHDDGDDDAEIMKEELDNSDEDDLDHIQQAPRRNRLSRNYTCETCNQKCSSKKMLARHMEQHVKDEEGVKEESIKKEDEEFEEDDDVYEGGLDWPMDTYECATCKKKYTTKKSLLRHQLLHEEPNFECDICNVKFYRKDKLKAHYDKCAEKNPDQVRKCNICGDTFENNEILKEHRAKHVMEGILTEEDLLEIEPKPEDKNGEKQRKRRTDIVGLECTECNKRYTSRKGLLRHIQVHEGKKYLCDMCPKKFYRREHLKIHVAKHNMIKPYKCPKCAKRFIKEEQLNNHITKHEKTAKKAKEPSSDTSKRFLCEICSKSFTQSTTLAAHLRAHNGIKPYVCEICSRPFTTNAYLKMHMRTHTQERPYTCQYCSRAFARADTLANHLTSHTGEAKYHCNHCPKHFRRLKSLKEHVFIHTGQRPYACPTCDRRFNNNGSRYAHSKRCKQNLLQGRPSGQVSLHSFDQEQQEQDEQQLQLHEEIQTQRLHQAQLIKPQNIKTITIARPDGGLTQQHVMTHQEILMPLILPLTVTLADVGEEVILPDGAKIFTA